MADEVPEIPREDMKPIERPRLPQERLGDPVPVPPFRGGAKVPVLDHVVLPARDGRLWEFMRHFILGFTGGAGAGMTAFASAGLMAWPYAWPIIAGLGVALGVVDGMRKIRRLDGKGDLTDAIYKILDIVLVWLKSRGVKK